MEYKRITQRDIDDEYIPNKSNPNSKGRKEIRFVFYLRNHKRLNFSQKIAAGLYYFYDGKLYPRKSFVHVELCVEGKDGEGNDCIISYGINAGEDRVHRSENKSYENKEFDPPTVLKTYVTTADYNRIIKFLEREHDPDHGHGFDDSYFWDFVPIVNWFKTPRDDAWFCSKLVATALLECKDDEYVDEDTHSRNHINPQSLYNLLVPQCVRIGPREIRVHSSKI
jgi:hypothetical protein